LKSFLRKDGHPNGIEAKVAIELVEDLDTYRLRVGVQDLPEELSKPPLAQATFEGLDNLSEVVRHCVEVSHDSVNDAVASCSSATDERFL
jgi:hypothetical protein